MNKICWILCLVIPFFSFFCGCSATYTYEPSIENKSILGQTAKLIKGKGVVVIEPKENAPGQIYPKSGKYTASAIREALLHYTNEVSILTKYDTNDIIPSVDKNRYSYIFKPEILHWEERATEWSGLPDRIGIKITVYDTTNDNILSSLIFYGKSKWLTFGGDHPQDLLFVPINKYIKSLYE
jgi:hypothetical protein